LALFAFLNIAFAQNYKLDDIIYTDKMTANSDESIQNIRVIDSVQINKEKNISEVLRNIPGVNIKRSSGIASFTYRGLPSRYSLILINGTRVNDSSSVDDSFDLNSIDISEVKKIEVMTGPAALAYGTSAVASVINIITNDYKNQLSTIQGFRQRYQVDKSFLTMNTSTHIGSFYEEQEQLSAAVNTEEKDLVIKKGVSLGHEWVTEEDSYKLSSLFNEYYNQIDAYIGSEFSDVEDVDVVKRIGLVNFEFKNERWSFSQNFYYNNIIRSYIIYNNHILLL
jgi:outer membrane cobalamin receptor